MEPYRNQELRKLQSRLENVANTSVVLNPTFTELVNSFCTLLGISNLEAADILGVSQPTVNRYRSGILVPPGYSFIFQQMIDEITRELEREQGVNVVGPTCWNKRFLKLAEFIACWSKDPSTRVGCVIVGPDKEIRSTGFNGFPRGVSDTNERLNTREKKYPLICHGEENAITQAARIGMSLKDCTAYIYPWPPCTRCARSLIQAGVSTIYYTKDNEIPERWKEEFDLSTEVLEEAGVKVVGL